MGYGGKKNNPIIKVDNQQLREEVNAQLAQKANKTDVTETASQLASAKNVLNAQVTTNNLSISDILKLLGVKDLSYEVLKKSVTKTNGYLRDFAKENELDSTLTLGAASSWDGTKITSTDSHSAAGTQFKYKHTSGEVRFLLNSVHFTIGLLVNGVNKVMLWHDGGNVIKCGLYNGSLTPYTPTFTKPSYINGTDYYYVHVNLTSATTADVYFYKLGDPKPTSPSLTFTFTKPTGTDDFLSISGLGGSPARLFEVSTNVVDEAANIYYQGRWFDYTVNSKPCKATINAGAEIHFDVDLASTITISKEDMVAGLPVAEMPYLSVSFDGGKYTRYQFTESDLTINTPNTNRHSVRIVVSALSYNGTYINKWTRNEGLAISAIKSNGKILKTNSINSLAQILWFGDSITEGQLMTAYNLSGLNAQLSYPHLVSHELNTLPIQVGFGGTGIMVGGNAGMMQAHNMVNNITSTIPASDYKDTIKLIVINYGTNDRSKNDPAGFKTAFLSYISDIQTAFPNVPILLIDPFTREVYPTEMEEIATEKGFNFFKVSGTVSTFDGIHPDTLEHRDVADQLKTYILNNYNLI